MDESFDEQVSLKTLIGNNSARAILQLHVDQFFNDRLAGLNPEHTPILLIGKSSSITVMARAISNSFGNLNFHTISSTWLNDGVISIHSFLGEGDEYSAYYIDGDKLNSNNQMQLFKILKDKWIWFYNLENQKWEKKPFRNCLIILSTSNQDELAPLLLKCFKIRVNLIPLNQKEIELALRQRQTLLNLKISSDDLITKIAQISSDVGRAMEILSMCLLIMQANSETILTEKVVNVALKLMDNNLKAGQKMG